MENISPFPPNNHSVLRVYGSGGSKGSMGLGSGV